MSLLNIFDQTLRIQLQIIKIKITKNEKKKLINKIRMMFIVKRYRIAFNISFITKF